MGVMRLLDAKLDLDVAGQWEKAYCLKRCQRE